jgi:hypothetical protein
VTFQLARRAIESPFRLQRNAVADQFQRGRCSGEYVLSVDGFTRRFVTREPHVHVVDTMHSHLRNSAETGTININYAESVIARILHSCAEGRPEELRMYRGEADQGKCKNGSP